jgi:polar amino acid transport system ATP-binding protein
VIRAERLAKSLGGKPVLADLDLEIARGEIFCLVGGSGAGKTTLLRCLGGLEAIDAGRISVAGDEIAAGSGNGQALARLRRRVGMVFQDLFLFPHRTALENVALAPRVVLEEEPRSAEARARTLLDRVGLDGLAGRYPSALSGGQRQRVAIARALAMRPEVLLYDEPTSALDPSLIGEVAALMASLKRDGLTQVVVTHEMRFAREVADRAGFLEGGRIVHCGAPGEVLSRAFAAADEPTSTKPGP